MRRPPRFRKSLVTLDYILWVEEKHFPVKIVQVFKTNSQSTLDPTLWNFAADDLLTRNIENCVTIAYADDTVAVVESDNPQGYDHKEELPGP